MYGYTTDYVVYNTETLQFRLLPTYVSIERWVSGASETIDNERMDKLHVLSIANTSKIRTHVPAHFLCVNPADPREVIEDLVAMVTEVRPVGWAICFWKRIGVLNTGSKIKSFQQNHVFQLVLIDIILNCLIIEAINQRIKDDDFGFAVIGCLVMVRRVHIWSSGCGLLSNAFDLISGSKFGEDISKYLETTPV